MESITLSSDSSQRPLPEWIQPPFGELQAELDAQYRRQLKKLSDFAFIFLTAAEGNPVEAEALLDDFVDLVVESGVLSTWRYRLLLAQIREGL